MVKIVLCDDNRQILQYYQTLLTKIAAESGIEVKIVCYESGEQLLFHLSDNPNSADIIYLDILMGQMNGVETAQKLREIGCVSLLIYLTTSNEYVFQAFDVESFYYIVKDSVSTQKFKEIFLKAVSALKKKEADFINITSGSTVSKVPLEQILYFEVRNRIITCHSGEGDYDFYATLEDLEQTLADKGFIRIYRSLLVNCHHIKKLQRLQLLLSVGTELPISTKYSQDVQIAFSKYLLRI